MQQYEWDEAKRLSNIDKHTIDFADAVAIFDGDCITILDDRFEYDEE